MDDEVPPAISGVGYGQPPLPSSNANKPLQNDSVKGSGTGFARFAGKEGVDGIAAYRKEMQARERRMRGLPAEEQVVGEFLPCSVEGRHSKDHLAPTLQGMQDDGEELSFLLPTARKVQSTTVTTATNTTVVLDSAPINPAAVAGRASRFTKHFETPTLSQANVAPTPTKAETEAKEKTALLAGILGINPPTGNTLSPAFTASPLHQRAPPAQASPHPGMPLFFSGPPPPGISSPVIHSQTPPTGQGDDHMSRLLNMLKSGGGNSSSPAATTSNPLHMSTASIPSPKPVVPIKSEEGPMQPAPQISAPLPTQSAAGVAASGPFGRESRFFGRQSGTTSSAQSPVESPIQTKSRLDDGLGEQSQLRWQKHESAGSSPTQHTKQVTPSSGLEATRSPMNQQSEPIPPPPGMFPNPPATHSPMFRQGQPMPPPGMDMTSSPMRPGQPQSDQENHAQQQGVFSPNAPGAMPPPFWQGGPPGPQQFPPPPLPLPLQYGGMLMHLHGSQHPPGYIPNQGFPPPPPGMQGRQGMMLPPHLSPGFGAAYPIGGVQHNNLGPGPPAPGYPYAMPSPGHLPPYVGQGGMPPAPTPAQSHGQMTNELMNMLGSMQGRNQEPRH